jgi:hypothetical protein
MSIQEGDIMLQYPILQRLGARGNNRFSLAQDSGNQIG